jgi:hypothetical protein
MTQFGGHRWIDPAIETASQPPIYKRIFGRALVDTDDDTERLIAATAR